MKGFATRLLACLRRLCESPADLGSPAADGEVVQLAESSELTTSFLLEPLAWRVRVVEHILVDSAHNCERRRSVQCAPLRQFLADRGFPVGAGARSAMVVVNVASVPRGPLMNFDVEGPLGSAYLLPRHAIAERQAAFLRRLATDASLVVTDGCYALLRGMVGLPLGDALAEYGTRRFSMVSYLRGGLGVADLSRYEKQWAELGESCVDLLGDRIDGDEDAIASLNPVMALPEAMSLLQLPSVDSSLEVLDRALVDLIVLLTEADHADRAQTEPGAASEFLNSLADYAVEYDLMVATRVPLDEPFMLKYSERRDLNLGTWSNGGSQDVVISDAASNHVVLEVSDPNIVLQNVRVTATNSDGATHGGFSSRDTGQAWTFYASDMDRDYRATLHFTARPTWRVGIVPYVVPCCWCCLPPGCGTAGRAGWGSWRSWQARPRWPRQCCSLETSPPLPRTFGDGPIFWSPGLCWRFLYRAWLSISVSVPRCSLKMRLDEFDNPTSLEVAMARNTGRGSRVGSVNAYSRSQMGSSTWSLREGTTGRFVEVKSTGGDLKGVRREK